MADTLAYRRLLVLLNVVHAAGVKAHVPKYRIRHLSMRPIAHREPLLEEAPFRCVARFSQRRLKMAAGTLAIAAAQFKLAKGGGTERIAGEPLIIRDRRHRGEAAVRSIALRNGDGAVERDDWRRID